MMAVSMAPPAPPAITCEMIPSGDRQFDVSSELFMLQQFWYKFHTYFSAAR
jgi:hypothetical protein